MRVFSFFFPQLTISIVSKNTYMIPKISTDIKVRVYESTQDYSLVFLGHLRLLTGRFCVAGHSHPLQQVLAKFRLSVLSVSLGCTAAEGGLSLQDLQITSFFIFLMEYKESLCAIREQIIFLLPVMP